MPDVVPVIDQRDRICPSVHREHPEPVRTALVAENAVAVARAHQVWRASRQRALIAAEISTGQVVEICGLPVACGGHVVEILHGRLVTVPSGDPEDGIEQMVWPG